MIYCNTALSVKCTITLKHNEKKTGNAMQERTITVCLIIFHFCNESDGLKGVVIFVVVLFAYTKHLLLIIAHYWCCYTVILNCLDFLSLLFLANK